MSRSGMLQAELSIELVSILNVSFSIDTKRGNELKY